MVAAGGLLTEATLRPYHLPVRAAARHREAARAAARRRADRPRARLGRDRRHGVDLAARLADEVRRLLRRADRGGRVRDRRWARRASASRSSCWPAAPTWGRRRSRLTSCCTPSESSRGTARPRTVPRPAAHVCDSSGDIMYPYAQFAPIASFQLDVGRNDYYGHTGSWLDAQDSQWLHRLDTTARLDLKLQGKGTVASDVPGVDCSASCATSWNPGTQVLLRALPAPNYVFAGWRGACGGESFCRVSLDSNTARRRSSRPTGSRWPSRSPAAAGSRAPPRASPARAAAPRSSARSRRRSCGPSPRRAGASPAGATAAAAQKLSCEFDLERATSVRATFARIRG